MIFLYDKINLTNLENINMALSIYEKKKVEKKITQLKKKISHFETKCEIWEQMVKGERTFNYSSKKYIFIFGMPFLLLIASLIIYFKAKQILTAGIVFGVGFAITLIVFFIVRLIDKSKLEDKIQRVKTDLVKLKSACDKLENGLDDIV